jgi:gliding motility-associated-like protein
MKKGLILFAVLLLSKLTSYSQNAVSANADDIKEKYVKKGAYLIPSGLASMPENYGDSLRGFNENRVKLDLMSRGFYGMEYMHMMSVEKRLYVDRKYKIGEYAPVVKNPNPVGNTTPKGGKGLGGNGNVYVAPCVNEDFENTAANAYTGASNSTAVQGWTIETANNNGQNGSCNTNTSAAFSPGSSEFWIVQTPVVGHPYIGTLPASPLGGTKVAQLNNTSPGVLITRISSTFPVTQANTLFQFAYAGSWDGSGHACCDQPFFRINMYDCNGNQLGCSSISLTPSGSSCPNGVQGYQITSGVSWCSWNVKYIDLTPYIGTCVTIRITNGDCDGGAHHGSLYFDAKCGGQLVGTSIPGVGGNVGGPVSFCAGSGLAQIVAPIGYATYSWVAPVGGAPIAAGQSTSATITLANPVVNSVYTVYLNSASGCQFLATNTIQTSTVSIIGIGANPSCPGGANGTASVVGNGSGSGYVYNWMNSNGTTVGTASTATGLAPGVYSVVISGQGSAGCGTAMATTTVIASPQPPQLLFKPYCGSQAFFMAPSGATNIQWYNGTSAITASLGGTAVSYTLNSPSSGGTFRAGYNLNGCRDSLIYTLAPAVPGGISVSSNTICPTGTNGTAIITMTPANGAPPGQFSVNVYNTGSITPTYSFQNGPGSVSIFTANNFVGGGTYSIQAFDGSCMYSTSYLQPTVTFSYNLSVSTASLCQGQSLSAGVVFTNNPLAGQYTYSWSPTTFLFNNIGSLQNTIITPTAPMGTNGLTIYTVVVTPTLAYCPLTKTLAVTSVNPPTPTITTIPNLCRHQNPYQIIVAPTGGTFYTSSSTGTANPIGATTGILTPTLVTNISSANTITYSVKVFTCSASQTATFQMSQLNPATLTSTISPLCTTSPIVNLMNIVQTTVNGVWSSTSVPSAASAIQGASGAQIFNPAALQNISGAAQTQPYVLTYSTQSTPIIDACPDVSTLQVTVTKTLVPVIEYVPAFCNNSATFNMTVTPTGGSWAGNGITSGGVVTPSLYSSAGVNLVSYSVAIGACVNTKTANLFVDKFNTASLTGTINNLCFNTGNINLNTIVQSTVNGSWTGPGVVQGGNVLSVANLTTGVYTLTYNTQPNINPAASTNYSPCPDSRTIAVSVLHPIVPTISQVGPLCTKGAPVQLSVSAQSGTWTASSFLNLNGVFTPSLASIGNNAVQFVVGTNTCNVQQTSYISVEAFEPANIISTVPDLCNNGSAINLQPITQSNKGMWSGPGISGTNFNPGVSGAGTFTLVHKTASSPSGLCPDQAQIAVRVYSLAPPVLAKLGPYCSTADPTQISVSPVGGLFGGANNNAVSYKGLFNPATAVIGDNVINYSITSGPCVAYGQTTITVEQFVSADFEKYAGPYCKNKEAIDLNSLARNPGGDWKGPGILNGSSMFNPNIATVGKNIITHKVVSKPTGLCVDEKSTEIEIKDLPKISIAADKFNGCVPTQVVFNTIGTNVGEGQWNFGDGVSEKGLLSSHVFTSTGSYFVTYYYSDQVCEVRLKIETPVVINEAPKANFSMPTEVLVSQPAVQVTNLSTVLGNNKYYWTLNGAKSPEIEGQVNPVLNLNKIGNYKLTLVAQNKEGCTDSVSRNIEVKSDFNIFIPTSFTPNDDGLNEEFIPVFTKDSNFDEKSFEMEIYDRWGHMLFKSKGLLKGWNGVFKGEPVKEEVYIYKIRYKDPEGNLNNITGHFTLLR